MQAAKHVKPTVEKCPIDGLLLIRPKIFPDNRGFFSETYNVNEWKEEIGFQYPMMQDNHSWSKAGVLRGLHAQPGMGKLVQVISGKIYDVGVDIRPGSKTYGQWHGVELDANEKVMFWLPSGFLHGFQVMSPEGAHVVYKCSSVYDQKGEFGCNPFDTDIAVKWPIMDPAKCVVSDRDKASPNLKELKAQGKC